MWNFCRDFIEILEWSHGLTSRKEKKGKRKVSWAIAEDCMRWYTNYVTLNFDFFDTWQPPPPGHAICMSALKFLYGLSRYAWPPPPLGAWHNLCTTPV